MREQPDNSVVRSAPRAPGKSVEIRGASENGRPELDGVYKAQDLFSGVPVYRNGRTNVFLVWNPSPPRWKAVPDRMSKVTLAYVDCPTRGGAGASPPAPFMAAGTWTVVLPDADAEIGAACDSMKRDADADGESCASTASAEKVRPAIECIFHGNTIVVSGRSGHNERMNGVFSELPEDYGGFPAYEDKERRAYIYRRPGAARWVISNRLGPSLRSGRGIVFAEAEGDVPQPFMVQGPWKIGACGNNASEEDSGIVVFLLARTSGVAAATPPGSAVLPSLSEVPSGATPSAASQGEAAGDAAPRQSDREELLLVRCRRCPELSGAYAQMPRLVNGRVLYHRPAADDVPDSYIFWEGECWCIGKDPEAKRKSCEVASQRREDAGNRNPEEMAWHGAEVIRAAASSCKHVDSSLLSALRGRTSALVRLFDS